MNPANEFVRGSDEAYCLAEYGKQYIVYAPNGGMIRMNLPGAGAGLKAEWLDPRTGEHQTHRCNRCEFAIPDSGT